MTQPQPDPQQPGTVEKPDDEPTSTTVVTTGNEPVPAPPPVDPNAVDPFA